MKSTQVKLEFLADRQDAIPVMKQWFERYWAPFYGPEGPGDAEADIRACCNKDKLPIALVAFCDDKPCGTASLKTESLTTHPDLSPWLAASLVPNIYQETAAADVLTTAIEDLARDLGFSTIYTGAEPDYAPLLGAGWTFLEKVPYFTSDAWLYYKDL